MRFKETGRRSLIKSVTFRILIIVSDLVIVYLLTKKTTVTIAVTVLTNIASTIFYYLHERFWNNIGWGRTTR